MKLLPFVHRSVPVMLDGQVCPLPLQLFRRPGGGSILRVGDTVLGFNEAGELDSYEFRCAASGHEAAQAIHDQAERQWIDGRGQAPTTAYYLTGSPGYRAEVAGWPTDGRPVMGPDKGQPYIVPVLIKNDRKGGAS